jgi:hypothetical protein
LDSDQLTAVKKEEISAQAKTLTTGDIKFLIETLNEKDDKLRYNAFLLLQAQSKEAPSVYPYWNVLEKKLDSDNSYQRSLGVMLIAENARWNIEGKFVKIFGKYMACCGDEKFITARQTIQGLATITQSTDRYNESIKAALTNLQFSQYKDNQRKLLIKDVAAALKFIKK